MKNPALREQPTYPIESVDKALQLLLLLQQQKGISVSRGADQLGVARSTAHRLLAMLQYHGLAQQDPVSKIYLAGPVLVEIGLTAVRGMDLRVLGRPIIESLSASLGETVHLAMMADRDVLFVDVAESSRPVRIGSRVGDRVPIHSAASGKVFLAELPREELARLLPARLAAVTDRTIRTRAKLEEELAQVRRQGYATNFGESEPDLAAVAAPVKSSAGRVRASITVTAPLSRVGEGWVGATAGPTISAARELGRQLE